MSKDHISLRKKLAAALCQMLVEDEDGRLVPAIPYEDAKRMTADQVISLFQFDHGIMEAIGGPTEHWNLTPRFIKQHREKTAQTDIPALRKSDRIEKDHAAFRARLLAKSSPESSVAETPRKLKQKMKSRPFAKPPAGTRMDWKTGRRVKAD